ncbi:MAG: YceH family protein [Blastopirellula sp. JB062]
MESDNGGERKWKPVTAVQRRILGVLIEKAKTTPDAYPMTLNALTTGCNQKSNRDPQMSLDADDVEDELDQLREIGAVAEVHGDGRVVKFRHYMKDWLDCEGNELAIMAELLLRGSQTVGELRGRAARMGKIPDMGTLQPILRGLQDKGLVIALTPEGRGQVVTHGLYSTRELEEQQRQFGGGKGVSATTPAAQRPVVQAHPVGQTGAASVAPASPPVEAADAPNESPLVRELRKEIEDLKGEMGRMKKDIEDLWSNLG